MSTQLAVKTKPTFRHRSNGQETEPKCVECGALWPCPIELLTHGGEPPASLQQDNDLSCSDPRHALSVEFYEDGTAWCYRCHVDYEYQGLHEPYSILERPEEQYCMGCEQDWPCATQRAREAHEAYLQYAQTGSYPEGASFGIDEEGQPYLIDPDVPYNERPMALQMSPKEELEDDDEGHTIWALVGWDPVEPGKLYVADHTSDPIEADMYVDLAESEGFWLVELYSS